MENGVFMREYFFVSLVVFFVRRDLFFVSLTAPRGGGVVENGVFMREYFFC